MNVDKNANGIYRINFCGFALQPRLRWLIREPRLSLIGIWWKFAFADTCRCKLLWVVCVCGLFGQGRRNLSTCICCWFVFRQRFWCPSIFYSCDELSWYFECLTKHYRVVESIVRVFLCLHEHSDWSVEWFVNSLVNLWLWIAAVEREMCAQMLGVDWCMDGCVDQWVSD